MHPNLAKQRLKEGRLALGLGLRQARTVDIASAAATCGFDWLFIDMEHNAMSVDTAAQIASAAPGMGVTPIVRVRSEEHTSELQSRVDLVCRLLLEKKNNTRQ